MNKILMIYLQNIPTTKHFDSTIIAKMLNSDIGFALSFDGKSIQDYYLQEYIEVLHDSSVPIKTSTVFHEKFCITADYLLSDNVKLSSGEVVNVNNYELILISHVWFNNYYVKYLKEKYPKLKIIGVQEEAVQDVISYSSYLQVLHLEVLKLFAGYITINKQFDMWISKMVSNHIYLSLPLPHNLFSNVKMAESKNNSICVGVGTWNLDYSNFYTNLLVLDGLRKKGFDLYGEIIGIRDWQRKQVEGYLRGIGNLKIYGEMGDILHEHLSGFKIAVLLSVRATSGRISAELAGLKVPCIGNINNELQAKCWPELSIDPYDVPRAISLANRLLEDKYFYKLNVDFAFEKVKELSNHQPVIGKLHDFLYKIMSNYD